MLTILADTKFGSFSFVYIAILFSEFVWTKFAQITIAQDEFTRCFDLYDKIDTCTEIGTKFQLFISKKFRNLIK